MKLVTFGLLVLLFSSLVFAQSSEIVAEFNVGVVEDNQDYVSSVTFWGMYGGYAIALFVALIALVAFSYNKHKSSGRRVKRSKRK